MLFPFETRQLYFNATAFGTSRAIVWLQEQRDKAFDQVRSTVRRDEVQDYRIGRIKHERVRVPRGENLLDWAIQVMNFHASRKSILEIEFENEEGTGLGPTLEFYALVAAELQRKTLGLWLCDDQETPTSPNESGKEGSVDLGHGNKPPGYYVQRAGGLFPAPLPQNSSQCDSAVTLFSFLGTLIAKVFQDNRLIDLPFSQPFLKLISQTPPPKSYEERLDDIPEDADRDANKVSSIADELLVSFINFLILRLQPRMISALSGT